MARRAFGRLPVEAAKEAAAAGQYWNSRLVDVKKDTFIVQLTGVEQVRGKDAYHIHVLLGPGVTREVFFDTQTHLMLRESGAVEQFDYEDYRPVNGIQTPYGIELHKGGHDYKISVTRAEFNSTVDNAVFDFPKASGIPLPDMKALLLDISKNQKALEELQRQYTWRVNSEEDEAGSKGQTKPKTIREVEVFPIAGGGTVGHLIGEGRQAAERRREERKKTSASTRRTKNGPRSKPRRRRNWPPIPKNKPKSRQSETRKKRRAFRIFCAPSASPIRGANDSAARKCWRSTLVRTPITSRSP